MTSIHDILQIALIVLSLAAVVAVVFLVRLLIQLRRTAAEAETTMVEVQALTRHLSELDLTIKARVEELGETLRASKKAAVGLSEATMMVSSKFLPAPTKFLPFVLPVARFFMKQLKKRKEKKNVE